MTGFTASQLARIRALVLRGVPRPLAEAMVRGVFKTYLRDICQ